MRSIKVLGLALACALVACGDPGESAGGADGGDNAGPDGDGGGRSPDGAPAVACTLPDSAGDAPDGLLTGPEAFAPDACAPGALAGGEIHGLWHLEMENQGAFRHGPVRVTCGNFGIEHGTTTSTYAPGYAAVTEDSLFWRRERNFGGNIYTYAYVACGQDDSGALVGQYGICGPDAVSDDDCYRDALTLERFGRIAGEGEAGGTELVSEWNGPESDPWPAPEDGGVFFTANVRVAGGVAHVVRQDGLFLVDVSDPESPSDLGRYPAPSNALNDLKLVDGPSGGRYALLASNAEGMVIVDVTDPASPEEVAIVGANGQSGTGVHTLFTETVADQTRAYVVTGGDYLGVWDVTDPRDAQPLTGTDKPTLRALLGPTDDPDDPDDDIPDNFGIHDLHVRGDIAYLNATYAGLVVVDASDPLNLELIGRYPTPGRYHHANWVTTANGRLVTLTGDEGYDAHIEVVDVDPESPEFMQVIGEFQTRPKASVHRMMVFGETAYVSWYQDGLRILDLADPTSPEQIGYFNTWSPETAPGSKFEGAAGLDVDLDKGLVYLADTPGGLVIVRDVTGG